MTRDKVIERITDELIRSRHINYKGVVSKVLSFLQPGDELGEGLVVAEKKDVRRQLTTAYSRGAVDGHSPDMDKVDSRIGEILEPWQ